MGCAMSDVGHGAIVIENDITVPQFFPDNETNRKNWKKIKQLKSIALAWNPKFLH